MNKTRKSYLHLRYINRRLNDGEGQGGGGAPAAASAAAPAAASGAAPAAQTAAPGGTVSFEQPTITVEGQMPTNQGTPAATPADDTWKTSLGDLAKNPTIANVKSVEDLAKMAVAGEKTLGELRAAAPKADATVEEAGKYFQGKYAPKDPKEYGLDQKPANMPEGAEFNAEAATEFAGFAHKIGLHPAQAKAIQGWAADLVGKSAATSGAESKALTDGYKTRWGNEWESRVDLNGRLMTQILGPNEMKLAQTLNGPSREALAVIIDGIRQKYVSDDTITPPTDTTHQNGGGQSLAQLQQEMKALQSEPEYFNRQANPVRHDELRKQISAISQKIANFNSGQK